MLYGKCKEIVDTIYHENISPRAEYIFFSLWPLKELECSVKWVSKLVTCFSEVSKIHTSHLKVSKYVFCFCQINTVFSVHITLLL